MWKYVIGVIIALGILGQIIGPGDGSTNSNAPTAKQMREAWCLNEARRMQNDGSLERLQAGGAVFDADLAKRAKRWERKCQ